MGNNRKIKLLSILIIFGIILGILPNISKAVDTSGRNFKLSYYRYHKTGTNSYASSQIGYAIIQSNISNIICK